MVVSAKQIKELFLYGKNGKSNDLVSDILIRPPLGVNSKGDSTVPQNMQDFMSTGAGRFVKGQHFNLVDQFFNEDISDFTENPAFQYGVSYKKDQIAGLLGITVPEIAARGRILKTEMIGGN